MLRLQGLLIGQLALVHLAGFLELLNALLELTDLVLVALLLSCDLTLILLDLLKVLLLLINDLFFLQLQFLIFLRDDLLLLIHLYSE